MEVDTDVDPKSVISQPFAPTKFALMAAEVDDKTMRKTQLVACRIEGHKVQKELSLKKKALDPLRYLPDSGNYYVLFTIAAYFDEGDTERRHVVFRSYKQFRSLHARLLKTYPKSNVPRDLPTVRNKKLSEEYIKEKRNELTSYLAQLMDIPQVKASNVLHEFLETSTALEDSSDDEDGYLVPSRMLEGLPGTIVTVRAGQSFSVTLPLNAAGDVASWQFTTKKHNIGFSATFDNDIIRAYSREGADVKPVTGFYRCSIPGTCTLTWDNTYTWSKAKVLIYWAEVESQNGTLQFNRQRQLPIASAAIQDGDRSNETSDAMLTSNGAGLDILNMENRRMGFIEHTRRNAMHPRTLVNSSISLLSKPFGHNHGGNEDVGKGRHLITRRTSGRTTTIPSEVQGSGPSMKAGSLIIQRNAKFRGRNWYRKWFVLDPRKGVLRYYDSEAAARRGLSLAKLNLSNKHVSLAITSSLSLDAAPTPYMFLIRTKKHCWKLCASSQSEYNEWENAISTAILTSQLSRRGRKHRKTKVKVGKSSAIQTDAHLSECEDESPQSGECMDAHGNAVATSYSSWDRSQPLHITEKTDDEDDDDDDSDNKEDGDSDDSDDYESESESDDEGDDIEVVHPGQGTNISIPGRSEAIGSLPDLRCLPLEWKFGLTVMLNVALLTVHFAPAGTIVLMLFLMDWHLLLH